MVGASRGLGWWLQSLLGARKPQGLPGMTGHHLDTGFGLERTKWAGVGGTAELLRAVTNTGVFSQNTRKAGSPASTDIDAARPEHLLTA